MSFGKNPHVAKAQAAEQKAADAIDAPARAMAYREAAHQWERAAGREPPGKRRSEYEQQAAHNRELADAGDAAEQGAEEPGEGAEPPSARLLN